MPWFIKRNKKATSAPTFVLDDPNGVEENLAVEEIELSPQDLIELDRLF
ncbi:MAG: hypothetical protein M1374_06830 [Firmicutes bacterium]|jgi:hypothetical protein|nr:hypothetical protein [Bacillota bacterium]